MTSADFIVRTAIWTILVEGHMPGCSRRATVTSLIPAVSCRSCPPNAPFAEVVRLSRTNIADEMHEEHRRRVLGK
jgi:hypothetical protein